MIDAFALLSRHQVTAQTVSLSHSSFDRFCVEKAVSRFRSAVHLVVSIPRSIIGNYSIIQKLSSLFCHPLDHTQLLRFAVPKSQLSGTGFERCAQPELRRSCLIRSASTAWTLLLFDVPGPRAPSKWPLPALGPEFAIVQRT